MQTEELRCLSHYASQVRKTAVEIGTFKGGSTCVISNALPEGAQLFAIDPFISDSMIPSLRGNFPVAFLNVLRHGKISKAKFLKDYSFKIAPRWTEVIDFLWIDGSHKYEDVKKDFEDWEKFVVKGGWILFHDSNQEGTSNDLGWPGPTRLCKEIKASRADVYEHVDTVKSIHVFRKR